MAKKGNLKTFRQVEGQSSLKAWGNANSDSQSSCNSSHGSGACRSTRSSPTFSPSGISDSQGDLLPAFDTKWADAALSSPDDILGLFTDEPPPLLGPLPSPLPVPAPPGVAPPPLPIDDDLLQDIKIWDGDDPDAVEDTVPASDREIAAAHTIALMEQSPCMAKAPLSIVLDSLVPASTVPLPDQIKFWAEASNEDPTMVYQALLHHQLEQSLLNVASPARALPKGDRRLPLSGEEKCVPSSSQGTKVQTSKETSSSMLDAASRKSTQSFAVAADDEDGSAVTPLRRKLPPSCDNRALQRDDILAYFVRFPVDSPVLTDLETQVRILRDEQGNEIGIGVRPSIGGIICCWYKEQKVTVQRDQDREELLGLVEAWTRPWPQPKTKGKGTGKGKKNGKNKRVVSGLPSIDELKRRKV